MPLYTYHRLYCSFNTGDNGLTHTGISVQNNKVTILKCNHIHKYTSQYTLVDSNSVVNTEIMRIWYI